MRSKPRFTGIPIVKRKFKISVIRFEELARFEIIVKQRIRLFHERN